MKLPHLWRAVRARVGVAACVLACACLPSALPAAPAPAAPATTPQGTPAPADLQQIYTAAMGAFNAGDFAPAAAGLEKVIAQAPPDALLESVYFTLGAAYFNLAQYPKAVEALGQYRTKYPKGARFAEATFSLGQAALLAKDYGTAAGAFKALENNAPYRGQALLLEGTAYREAGKPDDAIAALTRLYTEAVDKAGATAKLKEVTIGKARTLAATGNLDEARKGFEQVAGTREWRGEATAESVYSLGDLMRRQGKLPEAIAYYQRVFVAYGRYLPWVAKAYAASAECFEKLGKNQEALNTYREMVKNPKLQDFAETKAAREFLQKNGQG